MNINKRLDRYLSVLTDGTRQLYQLAYNMELCTEDTLTEDYQLVATIIELFEKRAQQYYPSD